MPTYPGDAFRRQSRSPNMAVMAPFDTLMVFVWVF